ncbi:hypothetical protein DIPPA_01478 [Diplonema papillatum]|nr:hypothetical protein DIPPA_01478 [Diplonema papillatum]
MSPQKAVAAAVPGWYAANGASDDRAMSGGGEDPAREMLHSFVLHVQGLQQRLRDLKSEREENAHLVQQLSHAVGRHEREFHADQSQSQPPGGGSEEGSALSAQEASDAIAGQRIRLAGGCKDADGDSGHNGSGHSDRGHGSSSSSSSEHSRQHSGSSRDHNNRDHADNSNSNRNRNGHSGSRRSSSSRDRSRQHSGSSPDHNNRYHAGNSDRIRIGHSGSRRSSNSRDHGSRHSGSGHHNNDTEHTSNRHHGSQHSGGSSHHHNNRDHNRNSHSDSPHGSHSSHSDHSSRHRSCQPSGSSHHTSNRDHSSQHSGNSHHHNDGDRNDRNRNSGHGSHSSSSSRHRSCQHSGSSRHNNDREHSNSYDRSAASDGFPSCVKARSPSSAPRNLLQQAAGTSPPASLANNRTSQPSNQCRQLPDGSSHQAPTTASTPNHGASRAQAVHSLVPATPNSHLALQPSPSPRASTPNHGASRAQAAHSLVPEAPNSHLALQPSPLPRTSTLDHGASRAPAARTSPRDAPTALNLQCEEAALHRHVQRLQLLGGHFNSPELASPTPTNNPSDARLLDTGLHEAAIHDHDEPSTGASSSPPVERFLFPSSGERPDAPAKLAELLLADLRRCEMARRDRLPVRSPCSPPATQRRVTFSPWAGAALSSPVSGLHSEEGAVLADVIMRGAKMRQ